MPKSYLESLQLNLHEVFKISDRAVMLGEDIIDPYGGAFKVSKGLSTKYPKRVFNTPISEASITGMGTGLAMQGFLPIVEIMFGDFLTLCADQIINHISKFSEMYPGVEVPIVIRTPMGAGRGYGATHSQSLEKLFLGIPGLNILSPSIFHDPGIILKETILNDKKPCIFIEQKCLYSKEIINSKNSNLTMKKSKNSSVEYPTLIVQNHSTKADVVIIAYGGTSLHIKNIMEKFIDEEILITAVFPSLINNDMTVDILEILDLSNKFLVIEDGTDGFNWSSEIAFQLYDNSTQKISVNRLSSKAEVIPASKLLEDEVIVTELKIEDSILEML